MSVNEKFTTVGRRHDGSISALAARRLRETARFMDEHAESLVGDLDGIYVLDGGLRFSFTLLDEEVVPTITVTKEAIVHGGPKNG